MDCISHCLMHSYLRHSVYTLPKLCLEVSWKKTCDILGSLKTQGHTTDCDNHCKSTKKGYLSLWFQCEWRAFIMSPPSPSSDDWTIVSTCPLFIRFLWFVFVILQLFLMNPIQQNHNHHLMLHATFNTQPVCLALNKLTKPI